MDVRPKISIIGIGDDGFEGLSRSAQDEIAFADVLVGPRKTLESLKGKGHDSAAKEMNYVAYTSLEQLTEAIDALGSRKAVLLASGDPLFFGTTKFLYERYGKEAFEILPHVSSMQLAFARVKESWDEAYLTNLDTQPIAKVIDKVRSAEKVGVFTSNAIPAESFAEKLLATGIDYFYAYVCENLGSPDERVTQGPLEDIARQKFTSLNVMILVREPGTPDRVGELLDIHLFGNPDSLFLQSQPKRGLLTPAEVRAVALAHMQLSPQSLVWDVGAGSGSVTIEAAMLAREGTAYGIEMDFDDFQLLVENAQRFGVRNVVPVHGEAPQAWADLPSPNAIFIGGTGRSVRLIAEQAWERLLPGGRLVISLADLENLAALKSLAEQWKLEPRVWLLQFSESNSQLDRLRLEASNPTFLFKLVKPVV